MTRKYSGRFLWCVVLGLLAGQTKITTVRFADDGANQTKPNQNVLTCTSGAVTTTSTRPHPFLGGEQ